MQWIHAQILDELSTHELYQMLRLRQDVFIVEQECIFSDIDNVDPLCEHLLLKIDNDIIGCSRIVPPGKIFEHPSIGRIAVHKEYRGKGLGKKIVEKSLKILSETGTENVIIEAQTYLLAFYKSLGFNTISEAYPVDGISHNKMIYRF